MEIKYEAVFGPQELFDCASDDAVLAIKDTTSGRIHIFTNDGWIKSGLKHERHIGTSDNGIAMRRIIKEPKRWTWEDKKAGVLPEVGAKCSHCHSVDKRTVLLVTDKYVGIERDNSDMNPYFVTHAEFLHYYIPIETPEEKAKRLREEWCIKALSSCSILSGMQKYELKRLGGYIEDIYDALLSGDLPVPVKGE